jgi:hypothetical protein
VLADGDEPDPVALSGLDLTQQVVQVRHRGQVAADVAQDHADAHDLDLLSVI